MDFTATDPLLNVEGGEPTLSLKPFSNGRIPRLPCWAACGRCCVASGPKHAMTLVHQCLSWSVRTPPSPRSSTSGWQKIKRLPAFRPSEFQDFATWTDSNIPSGSIPNTTAVCQTLARTRHSGESPVRHHLSPRRGLSASDSQPDYCGLDAYGDPPS
jgi:hypothetical protein